MISPFVAAIYTYIHMYMYMCVYINAHFVYLQVVMTSPFVAKLAANWSKLASLDISENKVRM